MEKILKENFPAILLVKGGRDTNLRVNLLQLQISEGLFMAAAERKNPPYKIVARIKKTPGYCYKYGLKPDGSGWLFRRVA